MHKHTFAYSSLTKRAHSISRRGEFKHQQHSDSIQHARFAWVLMQLIWVSEHQRTAVIVTGGLPNPIHTFIYVVVVLSRRISSISAEIDTLERLPLSEWCQPTNQPAATLTCLIALRADKPNYKRHNDVQAAWMRAAGPLSRSFEWVASLSHCAKWQNSRHRTDTLSHWIETVISFAQISGGSKHTNQNLIELIFVYYYGLRPFHKTYIFGKWVNSENKYLSTKIFFYILTFLLVQLAEMYSKPFKLWMGGMGFLDPVCFTKEDILFRRFLRTKIDLIEF